MRIAILSLLIAASPALAQEFKMEPGPKTPAESLKCIKTRPGFKVELMVAEPLVMDPIAFAWGPDGKFWVVEMGDYPLGTDGKNKPGGKIKFLEKTKPDGPYDKMTVFMEGVGFPTGVFPYGKGILVTCAPDIFYAEMGKDGKVQKEVIFTGFKEGNQQHRVNGLTWGIDNWIYGANGDSGGQITGAKKTGLLKREVKDGVIDIRGRDFRFKVETGEFEAVSGQSQFGRCRDDWGNWFGNNNTNPMYHYVLEDRYLKRNPHVLYPDVRVPVIPGPIRVYPISKPLPRFNSPQALNHFTSACSTIIYRDTLFGKEFEGNAFVSEPVHNLVHRAVVKPKGVTFTAERAEDEKESEFLASSDNWFRPTTIQVGPDGALWIADMYRYVIEHPEWIPKDWQKKLDLRAGHDLGRIYRVYPEGKTPREIVRMDKMKPEELVKQLESPSGPVRDMAHQLIASQPFKIIPAANDPLAVALKPMMTSPVPQARLHAMYLFLALGDVPTELISDRLEDKHSALRKHAIAVMELNGSIFFEDYVAPLHRDEDEKVRQQLAYSIGTSKFPQHRLAQILMENADNRYVMAAALSSFSKDNWEIVHDKLRMYPRIPPSVLGMIINLSSAYGRPVKTWQLVTQQFRSAEKLSKEQEFAYVVDLLDALEKGNLTIPKLRELYQEADADQTLARLKAISLAARKSFESTETPVADRINALRLLARGLGNDGDDYRSMMARLTPQTPDNLQSAIVQSMGRNFDPRVPGLLLGPWKSYSPALRGQVLDTLFSRPMWTRMTLDAIEKKTLPAHEIDAVRRQRLLSYKDAQVRAAAARVFAASSNPDRGKVLDLYTISLPEKTDSARGAKLFVKACATCHKLGDVGQNVGPDLASVGDKSVQGLLTAILDPNRAVESRYINYQATTKKGLTFSGILSAETSTTITLTANDGKTHQLLRNELEDLSSTGKSLMPEGLEKDLNYQDVADIIAYVRGNVAKRKEFPGNEPKTITPDKNGRLRLTASNAAIFGPSLVFEKKYKNLGYWMEKEDHAIWTIELAKETSFSCWLDFACPADNAGNTLAISSGNEKLTYKVEATGSWDLYQYQFVPGTLRVPAGKHVVVVRGENFVRGALLDLKEIELRPR